MQPTGSLDVDALERELIELIMEHFTDHQDGLRSETRLADVGIDSMATIQLLIRIEKRFGLWLPDDDVSSENLETVGSLARTLKRRLSERSGRG